MRKRILMIVGFAVAAAMFLTGLCILLLTPEGEHFSERENRRLTERPTASLDSLLNGSFEDGLESFLLDHFPLRERCIDAGNAIRQAGSFATWEDYARVAETVDETKDMQNVQEVEEAPEVTPRPTRTPAPTAIASPVPEQSETAESTATPEPIATATPRPTKPPLNKDDFPETLRQYTLLENGERKTNRTFDWAQLNRLCRLFDAYASLLPEDGTFVATFPIDSRVASRVMTHDGFIGITSEAEPYLHAATAPNVAVISSVDILSEHLVNGEYLYYRADRHWTAHGAYYVLKAMTEAAGVTLPPLESLTIEYEEGFLGTLYRSNPTAQMRSNPDTLEIAVPSHPVRATRYTDAKTTVEVPVIDYNAPGNDRYCVYLGGPTGLLTVAERTDGEIQTTCLLVTDSYGLCTVPMLLEVYDRVIVYDPRYYVKTIGSISEWVENLSVKDIYCILSEGYANDESYIRLCNIHY